MGPPASRDGRRRDLGRAAMLTCREMTELVTDRLEGRLGFRDRLRFELHLGLCQECRAYLRQIAAAVAALGRLPAEPIPPAVRDELLRRFRSWRATRRPV